MQNLQFYVESTSRLKQTGHFFSRSHKHRTKSVEYCSMWK